MTTKDWETMHSLLINRKKTDKYNDFEHKHNFVNIIYNTGKFNKLQNWVYEGKTESFHLSQNYS